VTNVQLQEATLKNMLVKRVDPALDAARVVLRDPMPQPAAADIPDMELALANALEVRPEIRQAEVNMQNQRISDRFTGEALAPSLSVFGFYAGSGLEGTNDQTSTGMSAALGQSFNGTYPEYAAGFTMNIPIRNRSAQADNLRSQLERNQLLISTQQLRNTISLEVRKAIIGLVQGKAQVEAAQKASGLARDLWQGEKDKLEAGASTSYQVILLERDFTSAKQAEVAAMVTYAKAIVEMDRARGATLDRNGIEFSDALSGTVSKTPVPPFGRQREAN